MKFYIFFIVMFLASCGTDNRSTNLISWQPFDTGIKSFNARILPLGKDDVWLVANGVHRFDGAEWKRVEMDSTDGTFMDLYPLADNKFVLISSTELFIWNGSSFTKVDNTGTSGFTSLARVWASSENLVFIANEDNSRVFRWNGESWFQWTLGFVQVKALWGYDVENLWLTGVGKSYSFDGLGWTEFSTGSYYPDRATGLWGAEPNKVWAIDSNENIRFYDGSSWTPRELERDDLDSLKAISGISENEIYAVGTRGRIAAYNGSWSVSSSGNSNEFFTSVMASKDASQVWAASIDEQTGDVKAYKKKLN